MTKAKTPPKDGIWTTDAKQLVVKLKVVSACSNESELIQEFNDLIFSNGGVFCWNDRVGIRTDLEGSNLSGSVPRKPLIPLLETLSGNIDISVRQSGELGLLCVEQGESNWTFPFKNESEVYNTQILFDAEIPKDHIAIPIDEEMRKKFASGFSNIIKSEKDPRFTGIIVDPKSNRFISGNGERLIAIPFEWPGDAKYKPFVIPQEIIRQVLDVSGDGTLIKLSEGDEVMGWRAEIGEYVIIGRDNNADVEVMCPKVEGMIKDYEAYKKHGNSINAEFKTAVDRVVATSSVWSGNVHFLSDKNKVVIRQEHGDKLGGKDVINLDRKLVSFYCLPQTIDWVLEGAVEFTAVDLSKGDTVLVCSTGEDGSIRLGSGKKE